MKRNILLAGLGFALLWHLPPSSAQTAISQGQIVKFLQGTQEKATLDPNSLAAMALQNIKMHPGQDAPSYIPISGVLGSLRQFNVQIDFDYNSDRIMPRSYEAIGAIADALHTPYLMGQKFVIIGNTDAKGSREYNLGLSMRRANAVREALATTFRVPASQLYAVGLGEENPADPAQPDAAVNRRVQLINIGF